MNKFRKRPVVIEAMRFVYPVTQELRDFMGDSLGAVEKHRNPEAGAYAVIKTLEDGPDGEAKHIATEGEWIIKGLSGHFYSCDPDIFAQTYEAVVETVTPRGTRKPPHMSAFHEVETVTPP
jgi:hypothetical protein